MKCEKNDLNWSSEEEKDAQAQAPSTGLEAGLWASEKELLLAEVDQLETRVSDLEQKLAVSARERESAEQQQRTIISELESKLELMKDFERNYSSMEMRLTSALQHNAMLEKQCASADKHEELLGIKRANQKKDEEISALRERVSELEHFATSLVDGGAAARETGTGETTATQRALERAQLRYVSVKQLLLQILSLEISDNY